MAVRELRVTDIRCRSPYCRAAPGQPCNTVNRYVSTHQVRTDEHAELVAEGWQWQEVDPRDAGARKEG